MVSPFLSHPESPEEGPMAYVFRCTDCHGGLAYILDTPQMHALLRTLFQSMHVLAVTPLLDLLEYGPMDRLWEIDVCTCQAPIV